MSEKGLISRPGEPPAALTRAVTRLMRPLIHVLVANGITFPVLTKLLKEIYVEVADAEFPIPGKAQTDSRINLLTGVHRKDIRVLRDQSRKGFSPSPALSRNAQMIAIWTASPDYLDERGRPKPLPRLGADKTAPSFETLVASISKDIRARAVLDEWLRQNLVTLDEQDMVHLNSQAFVPSEDFEDLAFYYGRNLRDHLSAAGHNLLGNEPPMLDRAVYYQGLTSGSVKKLEEMARATGSAALIKLNKQAFELSEQDKGDVDAVERISFGVYFYNHSEAVAGSDPVSDTKSGDDEV